MRISLPDYHMHTHLCGHATGQPVEYVEQALARGLLEIGFSDHAPMVSHRDPTVTMDFDQLPQYQHMIEAARQQFADRIDVLLGIEADYVPGYESKTREILDGYPYDYVIGSVHYMGDWGFDNSDEQERLKTFDINEVYRKYHKLLRASAASGLFDIMAHTDLVKKFGHFPTVDLTDEILTTARVFKENGVAVELNTSGLRKPAREMYPSFAMLKIFAETGIPLVFGSDAHQPQEVGMHFPEALALAKEAGYRECLRFRKREIVQVMPLP
jgi:histidinol-phosphatase (PHP family)